MECRICLDSDQPETMLSPCQCRGTAAYVHQRCLERYFQFYPDGICRVCMGQIVYFDTNVPALNYAMVLSCMLYYVWNANIDVVPKIYLAVGCIAILRMYYMMKMMSSHIAATSILLLLFYGIPMKDFAMGSIFLLFLVLYAAAHMVPPRYLGLVLTIEMLGLYSGLILYVAFTTLNSYGYAVSVVLSMLVWILWIKMRPVVHLE